MNQDKKDGIGIGLTVSIFVVLALAAAYRLGEETGNSKHVIHRYYFDEKDGHAVELEKEPGLNDL